MALNSNISLEELEKHNTEDSCWISLHGIVFEVDAKLLTDHPGGAASILRCAGKDCTNEFEDIGHSDIAREWCDRLRIVGRLQSFEHDENNKMGDRFKIPRVAELEPIQNVLEDTFSSFDATNFTPVKNNNMKGVEAQYKQLGPKRNILRISNIFVYPIKACAGVQVTHAEVKNTGFVHDREYVLVTEETNCVEGSDYHNLLNPYDLSALALIQPSIPTEDGIHIELRNDGIANHVKLTDKECVIFRTSDDSRKQRVLSRSIFVPRIDPKTHFNFIVCKYNHLKKCVVEGIDQGDDVADYISEFLRQVHCEKLSRVPRVRLLRFLNRKIIDSQKHTAQYAHPQASNYAPFMFTNQCTMKMLNRMYKGKNDSRSETLLSTIKRYRPNIVLRSNSSGSQTPFDEDSWERIEMEDFPSKYLKVVKSCGRCSHIFVNPLTAECDGEFIQKKLKNLGRDASGMSKKIQSKMKLHNLSMDQNSCMNEKEELDHDMSNCTTAASIDPILPRFYSHYEKFIKNGKPGKLFIGVCAMPSDALAVGSESASNDMNIIVGQRWRTIPSKSTISQYIREMSRKTEENHEIMQENRPEDLFVKYGKRFIDHLFCADETQRSSNESSEGTLDKMIPPFCEFLSKMTKHQKQPVKVTEVLQLTHDTKKIRLDFSDHLQFQDIDLLKVSGVACGKHINVFCDNPAFQRNRWNGMEQTDYEKGSIAIKRSFTPVACGNGYMDLVVKIYKANYGFSDGGRMTAHFVDELRVGDEISITGPHGHIEYLGLGKFSFSSTTTNFDKIGMVAGGSGITPMWQLIQTIHAEREMLPLQTSNLPSIHLIYGNKTRQDILLADNLANKDLFDKGTLSKITHVLSQQKEDDGQESMCQKEVSFTFGRRIDLNILRKNLPKPSKSTLILLCGPDAMVDSIRKLLVSNQLEYQDENIQIF